ncbi:MAG: class I SAM-dependent methyltransferase [Nanoarchaeota archaeon]
MKLIKIPISEMKNMKKRGFPELTPYTHSNPLVRWLFWKRIKIVLGLTSPAKRVLDFGAGSGILMPSLSKNFREVYSLDLDTTSLKYLKKKNNFNNVKIIKGNKNNKLPFKKDFFDIIFAADVLEHFKESLEIQKEFKRVLKKGGYLVVSGPTENILYEIGRKILYWRKKPSDHYTNVKEVMKKSSELFKIERVKTIPSHIIPAFKIYRAKKV